MAAQDPVVIVGGGLAGMTALYENLKNGVPTVLYEREPHRVGGVIRTKDAGNKLLNMGAELIDSSHTSLLTLCKELNVELIDTLADDPGDPPKDASGTGEEQAYYMNSATGKVCCDNDLLTPESDNRKATGMFIPLALEIREDYARIGKVAAGEDWLETDFNKTLDKMTAEEYLDGKCRKLAAAGWQVDPAVIAALENAYQCENGHELRDISALVFINQLGQGQTGEGIKLSEGFSVFGGSDERYKVPGGTETLISRMKERCEDIARVKGFPSPFQLGQTLKSIDRDADGKTVLNFRAQSGKMTAVTTDYVISALPAPALGATQGAENLGLTPEQVNVMAGLQYTHSSKVFFEVKGRPWEDFYAKGPDGKKRHVTDSGGNFYGGTIKECWVTGDEELTKDGTSWITCLVGGDENDKYQSPKHLIDAARNEYARILGKDPNDIFMKGGSPLGTAILYSKAAGGGIGCYASPGVGQGIPLMQLSRDLREGTAVGGRPVAGYVGTWIASVDRSNATPCLNVGYMEVGVENAVDASARCVEHMASLRRSGNDAEIPVTVAQEEPGLSGAFGQSSPRTTAELLKKPGPRTILSPPLKTNV